MMKKHVGAHGTVFERPAASRAFEQGKSSFNVCAHKGLRAGNRTVYVAFGRKMHDRIYIVIGEQFVLQRGIANVGFAKHIASFFVGSVRTEAALYVGKVFKVAAVSKAVRIDDSACKRRFIEQVVNKIAADKACAAGNQNIS